MNQYEMVVVIVAIVMIAGVLKSAFGLRGRRRGRDEPMAPQVRAENQALRDEVKQLRERLAVIERITVEKESSLERQIEALRERP